MNFEGSYLRKEMRIPAITIKYHNLSRVIIISFILSLFFPIPDYVYCTDIPNKTGSKPLKNISELLNESKLYFRTGRYDKTIRQSEQILTLCNNKEKYYNRIPSLVLIGESYIATAQYQKALENFEMALNIAKNHKDDYQTAILCGCMGKAHQLLNNFQQAESFFSECIKICLKSGFTDILPESYNNLGILYAEKGDFRKALELYQKSAETNGPYIEQNAYSAYLNSAGLFVEKQQNDLSYGAQTGFIQRGINSEDKLKSYDKNLLSDEKRIEYLKKSMAGIQSSEDSMRKGNSYISVAQIANKLRKSGSLPENIRVYLKKLAYEALLDAKELAEKIDNPKLKSLSLFSLAGFYEEENRYEEAMLLINQSIFCAQESDSPELLFRYEGRFARLLTLINEPDKAVSAYRRAIFYLDNFRNDLIGDCKRIKGMSFRNTVGPVYFGLSDLLLQKAALEKNLNVRQQYLTEARLTVEKMKQIELQDLFQDECIVALQSKITGIDRKIEKAVVIYPIILPDRIEMLVNLPDGLKQYKVPVDTKIIYERIISLRKALEQPDNNWFKLKSQNIYDLIIRPLEKDLASQNVNTLVFVPDGILRTVPMSALYDGEKYLIEKYSIAVSPGMKLTDLSPINNAGLNILLAGITESIRGFPSLPAVANEMKAIQNIYPCDLLINESFKLAEIENKLKITPYSVVHIASHGYFDSNPEKTFLLAYDNNLTINKLEDLMSLSQYRKNPVELLTLSSCQTAVGDELAALGLAGVALKSGARSAIASLWYINDQATADLISAFYYSLKNNKCSKAQALRHAQLKLINSPDFNHPAFWSPFLLIGNWL